MGLWQDWKNVMFNPTEFFNKLPAKEQYRKATIFYLTIEAISLALTILTFVPFMTLGLVQDPTMGLLGGLGTGLLVVVLVLAFPLILLFSWGMLYVGAGLIHLFISLFGGKKGFVETFKASAYSTAPGIFSFLPWIGNLAAVYSLILLIIGIKERHQLSIGRSIAAVLIPVGIIFILMVTIIAVIILLSGLQTGGFTP